MKSNQNKILLDAVTTGILVAFLFITVRNVSSFDLVEKTKEKLPCFEPETVTPNLTWMMSVDVWYYPLMSRLDLAEVYLDLTGKDSKDVAKEKEMHKNPCINWTVSPFIFSYTIQGYGHSQTHRFYPADFKLTTFRFKSDREGGMEGTSYTTLTDHKTFVFSATCHTKLNEMSWDVGTVNKTLPKKTIKLIHEHAKKLGFNPKYFTNQSYEDCGDDDVVEKSEGFEFTFPNLFNP